MAYIDGFVTPVLPGKRSTYVEQAHAMAKLLLEHGATQVVEGLDDDVPHGKLTDLWRAVQAGDGEGVAFSWIVWPSKEARTVGWEKAMADERMKPSADMPFDMKRMIFGGFEIVLDTAAA